jgi:hypothetical protein
MGTDCIGKNARDGDVPAGEGIGAFEIQLETFLHEALAIAPFMDPVLKVGVQDFHRCNGASA